MKWISLQKVDLTGGFCQAEQQKEGRNFLRAADNSTVSLFLSYPHDGLFTHLRVFTNLRRKSVG